MNMLAKGETADSRHVVTGAAVPTDALSVCQTVLVWCWQYCAFNSNLITVQNTTISTTKL